MIVNRFMWEDVEKVLLEKQRIRCAIKFEEVTDVKSQNINQKIRINFRMLRQ